MKIEMMELLSDKIDDIDLLKNVIEALDNMSSDDRMKIFNELKKCSCNKFACNIVIDSGVLRERTVDEQIDLMKVASYIGSKKSKEVNHSANMEKISDIIGFKMYLKGLKQKLGKCANIESDTMVLEFIPDKKDRRKEN